MKRIVFEDRDNNELTFYINDKGLLYLSCGEIDSEYPDSTGYICLDKEDVEDLIQELQNVLSEM